MEIIVTNKIPKNIFVLIVAKISNPFEIFFVNICVILRIIATNIIKISIENISVEEVIIKNQKDNPAVTASDLNLEEVVCILNWIDKCG
jgi:hypothetical protein|tara:strand:+ start:336 stop:602 length:267 start_codon:yes stop_codon:yes gene_type:complete